jgi:FKBP-type peptidyl-prolyl cis-trans isomerase
LTAFLNKLTESGKDIDTTSFGIYYINMEEGEGEFPKAGDSLEVGYVGYFIDGTLFDASDKMEENGTLEFILGNPPNIPGWDKGMELINRNAKVQLIIPSKYAYGSTGLGAIPPYKTLVFVVKMINLRPSK